MKKKVLFLIMACLPIVATHAEDYPYLTFQKADGTLLSVGVESLEMTFQDGNLNYTNSAGTGTLTVADLASMYFSSADVTAISSLTADSCDGKVQAFSLQGTSYGTFDSMQSMKASVPTGMYIVKTNGKTLKIAVK